MASMAISMRRSRSHPLARLDAVLNFGLFVEQPIHLVGVRPFAHPRVDLVEPRQQCADRRHGRFDIAADVEARVERRFLRQSSRW